MRVVFGLAWGLAGCVNPFEAPPRDCQERLAFFPDADGDGLGEPTGMVIACEAPEGYVTQLGPTADTGMPPTGDTAMPPTGHTGSAPTGDTAASPTGETGASGTGDTGP